jgi:hypothetical protein
VNEAMDEATFDHATDVIFHKILDTLNVWVEGCADPRQLLLCVSVRMGQDVTIAETTRSQMIADLRGASIVEAGAAVVGMSEPRAAIETAITTLQATPPDEIPVLFMGLSGANTLWLQTATAHYQPGGFTGRGGKA